LLDPIPAPITPGSGGGVSFEPPASVDGTATLSGGLVPVRGDQAITASALLGTVKGQPVFVQDILGPIDQNLRRVRQNSRNIDEFKTSARRIIDSQLNQHIERIFLLAAAEDSLTQRERDVIDVLVNKEAMKLRTDHGGSIPAADRFLRSQGTSYQARLAAIRRELIIAMFQSSHITPRLVVTYQMVRAAYERDPKAWQEDAQLELYSLGLPIRRWLPRTPTTDGTIGRVIPNPSPADIAKAEAEALAAARGMVEKLRALAPDKRGAEFARLVEDYGINDSSGDNTISRGGRTAGLKRGTFQDQAMEDFIFSQPANTVAPPYVLRDANSEQSAVYVIMVGDKRDARMIPFSEAEAKINQALREAQRQELWNELTRRLINPAEIEAVLRRPEVLLDAAVARYAME
jgi:hypothetical protein